MKTPSIGHDYHSTNHDRRDILSRRCLLAAGLCIGMQPREYEADPPVKEYDGKKPDDREIGRLPAAPAPHQPSMKIPCIDKPHNQGPCLFGVPAPVPPPGIIGPNGPQDNPESDKGESYRDKLIIEVIQEL